MAKNGVITTDFGRDDYVYSMAIQKDNKILLGGYSYHQDSSTGIETSSFALARYNLNGSLDKTFGLNGKVTIQFNTVSYGYQLALQQDNKIVMAGYSYHSDATTYIPSAISVARFNANGSLDTSFDNDGKVINSVGIEDYTYSTALQQDGKILVTGQSYLDDSYNTPTLFLARYNTDGSVDTSYGVNGSMTTDFGGDYNYGNKVILQTDNKAVVLVGGNSSDTAVNYYNFSIARYNTDGSLDTTFDTDGKIELANSSYINGTAIASGEDVSNISLQANGKIIAVGYTNSSNVDFVLWRYNSDGSVDNSFGTNGKVITDLGSNGDYANSIITQKDGKILVAGYTHTGNYYSIALARYNSNGSLDTSFDNDGIVITNLGVHSYAQAITTQADGKILVSGYSYRADITNPDFTLIRYNTDGSIDTSFNGLNTAPTGKVIISGEAVQGQGLTASNTLKDADGLGVMTYTWKMGAVVLATGNTYSPTANTVGKTLTVTASYTDGANTLETVNSLATLTVIGVINGDTNGASEDLLQGTLANERLYGLLANDELWGYNGNDSLYGGAGDDLLYGEIGNDVLQGDDGEDYLSGGAGNDKLDGGAGNDIVSGDMGKDTLFGGEGNDILLAGSGDDILNGGAANNTLSGGLGKDSFQFNTKTNAGIDKIKDFNIADDTLQLAKTVFTKLVAGNLGADAFVIATRANDANDYIIYNPTNGALSYDADGNGVNAPLQIAVLGTNLLLTNADFVVI